ncbi:MAG: RNA polymerase subunit sigma-24 [Flavobacteriaceae bacterium]|nr:MAG: RNA polymerase subunit sigma-24 [Flavobacteriaceae bacterium]
MAIQGKPLAQSFILETYWGEVFRYVFSKIGQEEQAEDITIETFTKVFAKISLYDTSMDFKTWIIAIAHNTMVDWTRKRKIHVESLEVDFLDKKLFLDEPSPEEAFINKQDKQYIESLIRTLSPGYQKVIQLFYMEEKSYKEISQELNISLANVKVRLLRAKQILEEKIKSNPADES